MIRVASPIPEPAAFDRNCRQKGLTWLKNHPQSDVRPKDFWSPFRDDLRNGFANRCGYFAMYLPEGHVDHFVSWAKAKAVNPNLAYEWDNFRFLSPSLNSKKGTLDDQLLDPFGVQDEWFEVELPSLVLRVTEAIPASLRTKAQFTLDRLDLEQGRKAVSLRREWYESYRSGRLSLPGLADYAPLVAKAVEKWQQNNLGPLPDIPAVFGGI